MIHYVAEPARAQIEVGANPFHRYTVDDDIVWTEFYRLKENYLLRFPGLADFEVSADGKSVIAIPVPGTDESTLEHLYINQLIPLALSRQGKPAYHASVVTVPGGAIAFLGESGMGKSTLAASFALNGATFLTDDALIIREELDGCYALPSHASIRLWHDSTDALIDTDNPKAAPISYSDKSRLLAGKALAHNTAPQRLLAAYELQDNGATEVLLRENNGAERQMAWTRNSFLLDIQDKDLLAKHFEWTHRVSEAVPTFGLDYPRDYGMLSIVRNAIQHHAKEVTK